MCALVFELTKPNYVKKLINIRVNSSKFFLKNNKIHPHFQTIGEYFLLQKNFIITFNVFFCMCMLKMLKHSRKKTSLAFFKA